MEQTTGEEAGTRAPLAGYRVGVLAHRDRQEQAEALERAGAEVVLGPAVRAVPAAWSEALEAVTEDVLADPPGAIVLTSVAGLAGWLAAAEEMGRDQELAEALAAAAVLTENVQVEAAATAMAVAVVRVLPAGEGWHGLASVGGDLSGRRVAVQVDAGRPVPGLVEGLRSESIEVVEVPVPVAGLPEDREPARRLVQDLVGGRLEALTVTAPAQIRNLVELGGEVVQLDEVVAALNDEVAVVCATRACEHAAHSVGVVDVVRPARPRLGAMVDALVECLGARNRHLELAGVEVTLHGTLAVIDGEEVWLAERERALLAVLARRPGTVVAKTELLRQVWRCDRAAHGDSHVVEVAVARLRRRLGPAGLALETVPRRGYRLIAGSFEGPARS